MGNRDRRAKVGLPQKRPFERSLLPPFQAGSFHYLSPHPAPGDLCFQDTCLHLLLRKPQGQEAGDIAQVNRKTDRRGQERERQSQLAEDTEQEDCCSGQDLPLEALEGKQDRRAGQKNRQRVASPRACESCRGSAGPGQGYEPHCTLAPRPSRCMYFTK